MHRGFVQPEEEPAVPRAEPAAQDHHLRGVQRGRPVPVHWGVRPLAQRARLGPPRPAWPGRAAGRRVPRPQVWHQLCGEYRTDSLSGQSMSYSFTLKKIQKN